MMSREDMHAHLNAAPDSAMNGVFRAAVAGLCANPSSLRPRDIVELALDICIADLQFSEPQDRSSEEK